MDPSEIGQRDLSGSDRAWIWSLGRSMKNEVRAQSTNSLQNLIALEWPAPHAVLPPIVPKNERRFWSSFRLLLFPFGAGSLVISILGAKSMHHFLRRFC